MTHGKPAQRSIAERARHVIKTMGRWQVPLSPENYHVWFVYLDGNDPELTVAIERIMREGGAFTTDACHELYNNFIGKQQADVLIREAQKETQAILRSILEEILSATGHASEYGNKLRQYTEQLGGSDELSDIQLLITKLIKETTDMAASSSQFRNRLDEAAKDTTRLRERLEKAEQEALTDALTGLHNRKGLDEKLRKLMASFHESGDVFAVIMVDIDFFKRFNDTYGHRVGDEVLQMVAATLRECVKGGDFPARIGGEEFVILLPDTNLEQACDVAEFVRIRMSRKRLLLARTGENVGQITVSQGTAAMKASDTEESLLDRADRALYSAKKSGRNIVKSEIDLVANGKRAS